MATELINSASDEYVHTLLSADSNVFYVIPKYQREYSWTKAEWEDLLQDIQEEPHGQGHFLGTIICMNTTVNATAGSTLELIDGQQRMTTLSILLVCLYRLLSDRKQTLTEEEELYQKYLNLRSRLVKAEQPRVRLQVQGSNAEDYRWLLCKNGLLKALSVNQPLWWGVRRIAKAFGYFHDALTAQLEELTDQAKQVAWLFDLVDRVSNAVLVKLEVKSHSSAFTLFESLNNRGKPLSPIDLIKNTLLMKAEQAGKDIDESYQQWMTILNDLGSNPADQERFLRYYYNAMEPVPKSGAVPMATRSNLIRLYEEYLGQGVDKFLDDVAAGAHHYGRIIDTVIDDHEGSALDRSTTALQQAQGSPGNVLLLYLMLRQKELGLTDQALARAGQNLTNFFVRRNLTAFPFTYELQTLFKEMVRKVSEMQGDGQITTYVADYLQSRSSSNEVFEKALRGTVYEDNQDMCRFILTALARHGYTNEIFVDLWERTGQSKPHYVWTIEHIFPQGERIPSSWVEMMGGAEAAESARERYVHTLGNLTLTGYNSTLGNRSFAEKRDRKDANGNYVGYRNGFNLNAQLAQEETWTVEKIVARTDEMVAEALKLFAMSAT